MRSADGQNLFTCPAASIWKSTGSLHAQHMKYPTHTQPHKLTLRDPQDRTNTTYAHINKFSHGTAHTHTHTQPDAHKHTQPERSSVL